MREPTSLRRLWKMYRERIAGELLNAHELQLLKESFCMGSIAMCRVLMHLAKRVANLPLGLRIVIRSARNDPTDAASRAR